MWHCIRISNNRGCQFPVSQRFHHCFNKTFWKQPKVNKYFRNESNINVFGWLPSTQKLGIFLKNLENGTERLYWPIKLSLSSCISEWNLACLSFIFFFLFLLCVKLMEHVSADHHILTVSSWLHLSQVQQGARGQLLSCSDQLKGQHFGAGL